MSNREKARAQIQVYAVEALDKIERIRAAIEARQNEAETANVHYGHAGDLGHVVELLAEVDQFLNGESE